jgi:DHA1 family tetracycline resistance protein-like MFS transporter
LGTVLGILLWPTLSDRVGRRPILAVSLLGSGLGLLVQALVVDRGGSLTHFLLARAVTGLFAGSSPVGKAHLADLGADDGRLPKYLAWKDASSTMAFILGPAAGGLLFDVRRRMVGGTALHLSKEEVLLQTSGSLAFVIAVSGAASLLASILAAVLVREGDALKTKTKRSVSSTKAAGGGEDPPRSTGTADGNNDGTADPTLLLSCPLGRNLWAGVASVCLVSFLFNVGDSTFHAFYSAFLRGRGVAVREIGLLYTSLACLSLAVSYTSASVILVSLGPALACAAGLATAGSGLLLLGVIASSGGGPLLLIPGLAVPAAAAAAAGLYFCGVPIYGPTVSAMLLRCVPPHRRGFILGVDGSINTLARVASPLAMGVLYRRYHAGAAFGVAGLAVMAGAGTALLRRYAVVRGGQEK